MSDDSPPPSLDDLDAKLRAAQAKRAQGEGKIGPKNGPGSKGSGLGFAFRIGVDLVAGIVVGVAIGLGLDSWLDTKPLFMIVFFFMGAGAGMLNVYRAAKGLGHAVGYRKDKEAEASDDER
jgi:ATP synthase protein I